MALLNKAKQQGEKEKPAAKSEENSGPEKNKKKHKAPPKASAQQADQQADADGSDQQDSGPEADDQQAPSESQDSAAPAGGDDGEQQEDAGGAGSAGQPGQAQGGEQGGQNAQGGSPVPDPNAPGAGISTGEDTADDDQDASPAGAQSAMGGPQSASTANIPLSPALKEAYQALDHELMQTLYQKGAAEHILPALYAQGPDKIKSIVTVSVMLAKAIFTKQKAPLPLALPFARDTAAHVMQIGEQVKSIQYSDQECTAVFGAVYEGMLRAFGVTKQQFTHAQHMMPKSQMSQHAQAYVAAHQHAQSAIEQNNNTPHADHTGPAGPPAQAAGPQGPQGAPQGGALAQGAAASEQPPQGGEDQGEEQGEAA